jgi:NitT/TauT family transport system ATP-binding protein
MVAHEKKEVILKAENVSLSYGDNVILRDINVEIKNIVVPGKNQGQIIGFLGPSGIGKTKFFEVLSGIIPFDFETAPSQEIIKKRERTVIGKVLIDVDLKPVQLGKVGVIQQSYPLFMHRTVFKNLDIAAAVKFPNKKERLERINDLLERFDLMKRKDYYPAQLSGGQKQRVAIAQQILSSNHFLLMDEPFSGLDPNMVRKVSNLISEVANMHELNTIIIVSHDIHSTAAISDTLWVMGRDRDVKGEIIPGAKIKHEYDLIQMGFAWQPEIKRNLQFQQFCSEIDLMFPNL